MTIPLSPGRASAGKQIVPVREPLQSQANRTRPRWVMSVLWLYSYSDHAITLLLLGMLGISAFAIRQGPIRLGDFNYIDSSWALQIAFNSHQGVWLNRDVWFSYGPLFEWLLRACTWPHKWSLGAFFKYGRWLGVSSVHYGGWLTGFFIIAATWAICAFLLRGQPPWKRLFYIFELVVFWMYWDVRPVADVLLFAVAVYECDRIRNRSAGLPRALCLGLFITLAFLLSADAGVYALAGFLIVSFSYLCWYRTVPGYFRRVLRFVVWVTAGVAAGTFLTGVILTRSNGVEFWRMNLALLQGYRWAMSIPFDAALAARLFFVTGMTLTIFVLGWIWRDARSLCPVRHPAFLTAAALFSLLMLQSSLVRADWEHVFFGLIPGIMLVGAVLMGADTDSRGRAWQYLPVFLALGLTAVFSPAPNPSFVPSMLARHVSSYRLQAAKSCPPGTSYLNGACFLESDYNLIHTVAQYIAGHSAPSDWIAIFPYQNIYGVAANRKVAGGILQNYAAIGDQLVARHIAGLESTKPSLAVYSVDGVGWGGIDGVPNLTRSPEIWLYLQSHYESVAEPVPGVAILQRDSARQQHWKMQVTDLPVSQEARNAHFGGSTGLEVAADLSWPAEAAFLRLTVQVRYPFWWHVLKPRHLLVTLGFADGTEKNVVAIAEPNRPANIWIYPWRDADLQNYFSADDTTWRSAAPGTPLRRVSIMPYGRDVFSVDPTSIRVTGLQAVELSLGNMPH